MALQPARPEPPPKTSARVDLPDIDFPSTRYYWTVVPVELRTLADKSMRYVDVDLPQDACAAGRVASFGKESDPVRVGSGTPYVSGLTPNGRLLSSSGKQPTVFSTPLVAWEPATGASAYEVQWSRTKYPWRAQGSKTTYSTSRGARPHARKVVLPRARPQPDADPQAADDLVDPRQAHGLEAELPRREQLAEGDKVGAR